MQNWLPLYPTVQLLELSPALEKGQQPQANQIGFSATPALQYKITKYDCSYIRVGSVSIGYRLYAVISFAVASAAVLVLGTTLNGLYDDSTTLESITVSLNRAARRIFPLSRREFSQAGGIAPLCQLARCHSTTPMIKISTSALYLLLHLY